MFIQTEDTPNPETIKFIPGQTIMSSGVAEFKNEEQAKQAPLVKKLFQIKDIETVFLSSDFISVTKKEKADWEDLKPMILLALMEYLSSGLPVIEEGFTAPEDDDSSEEETETTAAIKELLDSRVRPMVAMDGGDISFHSYKDGVVYLKMKGACAGCPSSTATLKHGIENMLRHFIPEIEEVQAAPEY